MLTREEQTGLGLEPPGKPNRKQEGFACDWNGSEFSMIIVVGWARPLAEFEASRPGKRVTVGGRAGWMADGRTDFAGLCDLGLDVGRIASVEVLLTRYDKNTEVACLDAVKVAGILHPPAARRLTVGEARSG